MTTPAPAGQPPHNALAVVIHHLRPDWSVPAILTALGAVSSRTFPDIAEAALRIARDPESKHPGRITVDGPWWRPAHASDDHTPQPPRYDPVLHHRPADPATAGAHATRARTAMRASRLDTLETA